MTEKLPRRSPQPGIDASIVREGAEFVKNRARDVGQPPITVVVDDVVTVAGSGMRVVHYHYKESGRRRNMPLDSFCQGSEHRYPSPEPAVVEPAQEETPASGQRATQGDSTLHEMVFRLSLEMESHQRKLDEILALLRKPRATQLELVTQR